MNDANSNILRMKMTDKELETIVRSHVERCEGLPEQLLERMSPEQLEMAARIFGTSGQGYQHTFFAYAEKIRRFHKMKSRPLMLKQGYPVAADAINDDDPQYVRPEYVTEEGLQYNLERLDREAQAMLRERDALKSWWETYKDKMPAERIAALAVLRVLWAKQAP
jgi:hypothetical protein